LPDLLFGKGPNLVQKTAKKDPILKQGAKNVVPGSPFEIGAHPFHVWSPGCYIHPMLYFENVAPPSGFLPLLLVLGPHAAKSWRRACKYVMKDRKRTT